MAKEDKPKKEKKDKKDKKEKKEKKPKKEKKKKGEKSSGKGGPITYNKRIAVCGDEEVVNKVMETATQSFVLNLYKYSINMDLEKGTDAQGQLLMDTYDAYLVVYDIRSPMSNRFAADKILPALKQSSVNEPILIAGVGLEYRCGDETNIAPRSCNKFLLDSCHSSRKFATELVSLNRDLLAHGIGFLLTNAFTEEFEEPLNEPAEQDGKKKKKKEKKEKPPKEKKEKKKKDKKAK